MLSARKTQCFARRFPALYVPPHPIRFSNPIIPKQNRSHHSNVICDGSPSRIRIVRRISLGMTTRPRSSIRRTIPVAFILKTPFASDGCYVALAKHSIHKFSRVMLADAMEKFGNYPERRWCGTEKEFWEGLIWSVISIAYHNPKDFFGCFLTEPQLYSQVP